MPNESITPAAVEVVCCELREQLILVTLERDQLRARLAAVTAEIDRIASKYRGNLSDAEFARRFPFQLLQERIPTAATESETQRG